MTSRYASDTKVPVDQSRAELVRVLERYGAKEHGIMQRERSVGIQFKMNNLVIAFDVPLPDPKASEWWITPAGNRSTSQDFASKQYRQALMQRWRAIVLYTKAMLEAVAAGIISFEEAFLAHIVLPGTDRSVGEIMVEEIRNKAKALPAPGQTSAAS